MRHRKSGRKFGMDSSARKAMIRNMVTSLLVHGQIRTTEARAKELRRYAERLISIGKRAPTRADLDGLTGGELQRASARRVAAIRRLKQVVMTDEAVQLVMGEYADRYRTRPGGYTRVLKLGRPRPGDNSRMALIALVTEACEPKAKRETAPAAEAEAAPAPEAEAAPVAEATSADVEASAEDVPADAPEPEAEAAPAAEGEDAGETDPEKAGE